MPPLSLGQTQEESEDFTIHIGETFYGFREDQLLVGGYTSLGQTTPKWFHYPFKVSTFVKGSRSFQATSREPLLDIKFTDVNASTIITTTPTLPGINIIDPFPNLVGKMEKIPQSSSCKVCAGHIMVILWVSGSILLSHSSEPFRQIHHPLVARIPCRMARTDPRPRP